MYTTYPTVPGGDSGQYSVNEIQDHLSHDKYALSGVKQHQLFSAILICPPRPWNCTANL